MAVTDKDKIAVQAKKIMDNFADALGAEGSGIDFEVKRDENIRGSDAKLQTNKDFRERMLANAPKSKDGYIVAEKKIW